MIQPPRPIVLGAATLLAIALAGCQSPAPTTPDPAIPVNPLYVDPASYNFGENPKLLERLKASPHRYLRFINVPFSEEVCQRFSEHVATAPSFNLHGDAHIEQYAITDQGRGMTDFDDSSTGPAILDLVRFGVSVRLACQNQGCDDASGAIYDEFLRGYRAALDDPTFESPEPRLATRKREKFGADRSGFFKFVESSMEPVPDEEAEGLKASLGPYFHAMKAEHENLGAGYFDIVSLGYLRSGVGSALDIKYLVRIRAASDDPLDDVVLEVKQVRDLSGVSCITTQPGADPLRVVRGHIRIANQPYRYLGYSRFRGYNFWVHAWAESYAELEIDEDFGSVDEVKEVALDVGAQLGRGHARLIAAQLENQLRQEQLLLLDQDEAKIKQACEELARQALEAWDEFKSKV